MRLIRMCRLRGPQIGHDHLRQPSANMCGSYSSASLANVAIAFGHIAVGESHCGSRSVVDVVSDVDMSREGCCSNTAFRVLFEALFRLRCRFNAFGTSSPRWTVSNGDRWGPRQSLEYSVSSTCPSTPVAPRLPVRVGCSGCTAAEPYPPDAWAMVVACVLRCKWTTTDCGSVIGEPLSVVCPSRDDGRDSFHRVAEASLCIHSHDADRPALSYD